MNTGCMTCGDVGGLSMLPCNRHCRPCHIYCGCPVAKTVVLEIRDELKDVPGYAGTVYDR